jgi:hypothetical protein
MKKLSLLALVTGAVFNVGDACAVQYTWDLDGSPAAIDPATDFPACGPTGNVAKCELLYMSSNGGLLRARAYSTQRNSSAVTSSALVSAEIVQYTGGLGVKNIQSNSVGSETNSPYHSVDNVGDVYDIIVFEAPTDNFNWNTFSLGWVGPSNAAGATADVQMWVGNAGGVTGLDFSTMCLEAVGSCAASSAINDTASGFKTLGAVAPATNDLAKNTNVDPYGKGRYLVVAGALGGGADATFNDYFKVNSAGGIPEPGVLMLLGVGVLGVIASRRRQSYFKF